MPNNPERSAMVEQSGIWLADSGFTGDDVLLVAGEMADFALAQVAATRAGIAAELKLHLKSLDGTESVGAKGPWMSKLRRMVEQMEDK